MNDSFFEVLHRQYCDQIHECVLECTHSHPIKHNKMVDYTKLMEKLHFVFQAAKHDGVSEDTFTSWVQEAAPFSNLRTDRPFFIPTGKTIESSRSKRAA